MKKEKRGEGKEDERKERRTPSKQLKENRKQSEDTITKGQELRDAQGCNNIPSIHFSEL